MNKLATILTAGVVGALAAFGVQHFAPQQTGVAIEKPAKETTYERVMRTKTLRCGYYIWPTFLEKNLKTGKMEGFFVDIVEEIAKGYDWKVDWVAEINLSEFAAALDTGHVDMLCGGLGIVPQRAAHALFSTPVGYGPVVAYARADDDRFDNNQEAVNNANVTLSTMEGAITSMIARTQFPKARVLEITSMQGGPILFENVAAKKADIVFQDPASFEMYNAHNPNKLKMVPDVGMGVFSFGFPMQANQTQFKWLIDTGIADLQNRGVIEQLFEKYKLHGLVFEQTKLYEEE
jgi:ABC-type amino acid transport substrate-binding protein